MLWFIMILIGAVGMCFNVFMFMAAYHNIDLAQNMRYLNAKYNMSLSDQASNMEIYSPEEMLHIGYDQFRQAIWGLLATACIFGYYAACAVEPIYNSLKTNGGR